MKKIFFLLAISALFFIISCTKTEYLLCPDNITKVSDLKDCPLPKPKCPNTCDDGINCTLDICNAATNYSCSHKEIKPCDGNKICEIGEFSLSNDCPKSCEDKDECTTDTFNYELKKCTHELISPCCGNKQCDRGETYINCPLDCKQLLSLKITSYEKRQRVERAYADLTGTDHIFLIVKFKIKNIELDLLETLNYKKERGFYYDPFKMRLEDDLGNLYNVEYDSDILKGWLDYSIIPKGHTTDAALLFIIPLHTKHTRLIAYDKYGSRLAIAEVY